MQKTTNCKICGEKLVNFFYDEGTQAHKNALVCLRCKYAIEFDGDNIIQRKVGFQINQKEEE